MFNNEEIKYVSLEEVDNSKKYQDIMLEAINKDFYNKFNVGDSIMLVLSSIDYQKSVLSRTLLQRAVFLFYEDVLKNLKLSEGAKDAGYFPYKYGPYSIDVNVALSTLIVSGKVRVENFYKDNNKRFLAKFITDTDFNKIAAKYEELLSSKGIPIEIFHEIISKNKQSWDQSGIKGINKLLYSENFKSWYKEGVTLTNVFPFIRFGKITEDYIPRKRNKNA